MKDNRYISKSVNKVQVLLMVETLILTVGGLTFISEQFYKVFTALCMWGAFAYLPWRYRKIKDVPAHFRYCIYLLMLFGVFTIIHTLINRDDPYLDSLGNRYLTLFGNVLMAPLMLLPIFGLFSTNLINQHFIKRVVFIISISSIFLYINPTYLNNGYILIFFLLPFLPLMSKNNKIDSRFIILLILVIVSMTYDAFVGDNPTRTNLIYIGFMFLLLVNHIVFGKNKKLIYILFVFIIFFLVYSFYLAIYENSSIIAQFSEIIDSEGTNVDATDTRTFLYAEVLQDLLGSNSIWIGKGAYCHYYSEFFAMSQTGNGDFWQRNGVEVDFLNLMLKGGLIYIILYLYIVINSIYKALKKSNSKFMKDVAVVLIGFFFVGFISSVGIVSLTSIAPWILIGLCNSKKWLSYTDSQIKEILALKF
ncbi:hypothetical protein [Prevotella sp.]|uniref:hypothetical protein n=1 Tax=Prevotella sp. TaxID=59823 RepID=UPI003DA49714